MYLRRHNKYIVVEADKNLGPCILDRIVYIRRGCSEHLGNKRNYKIISSQAASTLMTGLRYQFEEWYRRYYLDQYYARLDGNELEFDGPVGISDAEGTLSSPTSNRS